MALKRTAPNRATVPNSRRPVDSLSGKLYPSVNTIKPGYPEESWSVSAKVPPIVCESLNVAAWALLKPVHIVILLAVVSLITVTPKYSPLCRGSIMHPHALAMVALGGGLGVTSLLVYLMAACVIPLSIIWRPIVGLYMLLPLMPLQTMRYHLQAL